MRRDAIFISRFVDILMDGWAVSDCFFMQPWFEAIAQGVHVRVRPDAGVTEKVPSAAHVSALFDNGIAFIGALHGQMRRRTDAG